MEGGAVLMHYYLMSVADPTGIDDLASGYSLICPARDRKVFLFPGNRLANESLSQLSQ